MGVTVANRIRQDYAGKLVMGCVVDASATAALLFNEVAAPWVRDETSDRRCAV
jgi:hypothetical protein